MSTTYSKGYFIYIDGEMLPVSEAVYREYYRPIWRVHQVARYHNQCACPHWQLCTGDCGSCRFTRAGDRLFLDHLSEYGIEPTMSNANPLDIVTDAITLEELLDELDKIDPDGRRIATAKLNGFSDAEVARQLGMPKSTFADKKKKLKRGLKKLYE